MSVLHPSLAYCPNDILKSDCFPAPLPGSPPEPRSEQGAAAGEHHQRLRPRAVQESAGTCLGRPCKRENSSSPPSLTSFSFPFFLPSPFAVLLFFFFFGSVHKPSPAAAGAAIFLVVWTSSNFPLLSVCLFFSFALLFCDPVRCTALLLSFSQLIINTLHCLHFFKI